MSGDCRWIIYLLVTCSDLLRCVVALLRCCVVALLRCVVVLRCDAMRCVVLCARQNARKCSDSNEQSNGSDSIEAGRACALIDLKCWR